MPGTQSTSFIPKQGPVRRPRQTASRHVHLLSIISYVVFSSTLVASVGIFLYQKHVERQLQDQIENLDKAIASFSESDMNQVREFNVRLSQARDRLDNGVSVVAIFDALEEATLKSVSLKSLMLERFADDKLVLSANVMTNSFDSSLFQRGVFERSRIVDSVEVEELSISEEVDEDGQPINTGVSFTARIGVPISGVPNIPSVSTQSQTIVEETPVPDNSIATTTSNGGEDLEQVNDIQI